MSRLFGVFTFAGLAVGAIAWAEDAPCPSSTIKNAPAPALPRGTAKGDKRSEKITYDADEVTGGINGDANLKGNVHVQQGDREIRANDVEYNQADTAIKVNGKLEYLDPQVRVTGSSGHYSAAGGADFTAAEFELRQSPARGAAEIMRLSPSGDLVLDRVKFTTCPREDEAWQIRAKTINLDTREQIGTGRNASVNFKGVPILYLPWLSFPLSNERKSGFLFPSLGHSNRSGLQFAIPYYWNIAPQLDLTFEPVYYSMRGVDVAGGLRYLTSRQRGSLDVNYLPADRITDDSRHSLRLQHLAELPRDFRFTVDAQTVSDTEYFEDFAQGPEGTSVAFVERHAQISYRDEHWLLAGEVQHFQTIDRDLTDLERPYARLPRVVANGDFGWGAAERFRYGFDSELVNFDRSTGVTGWRLDAMPTARLDLGGPGYFLRPGLAWRHTQYELQDAAVGQDESPSRSLPIASLDAGLVFERPSGSRAQRRLTLEPRLLYLNIPYRNQDGLPLFDTALPDLNLVQLFRTNRYVGADRVSDANQMSIGVTSRLYDAANGAQFLSATLGQIRYFDTPRVRLPDETPGSRHSSDLVAQLALTAYKNWNADLGLQWNPENSQSERAQVSLQYKPGPERVVNVGYRLQRDRLEQAETSAAWPIAQRWNAYARYVYSLQESTALERFAGVEYRSCCWRLRVLGRRFVSNRTGEQDTGIYLQLELTGLASVGSAADAFLSSAIRGYSKPD